MAQPDIIRGTYFSLMLGDGAGPETFAALCGITTATSPPVEHQRRSPATARIRRTCRSATSSSPGKQWEPDRRGRAQPRQPRDIQAADATTQNWRYYFTEPTDDDLVYQGYYQGAGVITNFKITATDENFATISLTIESDGEWTWTPSDRLNAQHDRP
jgi:hypothetical protein